MLRYILYLEWLSGSMLDTAVAARRSITIINADPTSPHKQLVVVLGWLINTVKFLFAFIVLIFVIVIVA